ncbi:MAG TPA: hypothetical protein ENJ42_06830 [Hellea balneolensis]|uniref:Glutamine amidotransferase domain-containing protein n=1 Tax=Hellea balneolensis TaxID=287478 RepID=A0A7C5LVL1_9PROT|nr:hypothetical protein [Hellea balneolensis]
MKSSIAFDPLIPVWAIIALTVLAIVLTFFGEWKGLKSAIFRAVAIFTLTGALLNPQKLLEERTPLPDIALVVVDNSESMNLKGRTQARNQALQTLSTKLQDLDNLETITIEAAPSPDGTMLMAAINEGLGQIPTDRLAGVIAITDGRIHDLPKNAGNPVGNTAPLHAIIIGDQNARDRRLQALILPKFGLVSEKANFVIRIDDPGHEGERANLQIKLNGEIVTSFPAIIGDKLTIPLKIEKRSTNTVEFLVETADGELTTLNNFLVAEVSGIRDRLRVLLITGEPHRGGRAWRNLLKSDPSVDLVQFTILTNPGEKTPAARTNELSLIEFPTAELFEEKLPEFDLIIFDQFRRRTMFGRRSSRPMINPVYFANVARYVEDGGALLVATGPAFAGEQSLARSPLIAVLPARPTGKIDTESFKPSLSDKGKRHPITAIFDGETATRWGQWHRTIKAKAIGGHVLMQNESEDPLLVVDKIGKGRVALLLSDQAWLWAKGHDGGGPYNEIFKRLAHWLMGEPDLEADRLNAKISGGILTVEQKTLEDKPQPINIIKPNGETVKLSLKRVKAGQFQGAIKVEQTGAYRISGGDLSVVAAAGALNPIEYEQILPTAAIIAPLVEQTGGHIFNSTDGQSLPAFRKVKSGKSAGSETFAGLIDNQAFDVTASKRTPFGPGYIYFLIALIALLVAWRVEGR